MIKAVKKVWGWVKNFYNSATTASDKDGLEVGHQQNKVSVKGPEYWAEVSQRLQEEARIQAYFEQQEKLAKRTDEDAVRLYRENIQMEIELRAKLAQAQSKQKRKSHLRVVNN
jgi:hypothetical protein